MQYNFDFMVPEEIELTFDGVCNLVFTEATLEECVIHSRNSERDDQYYLHFISDFINEYSDTDFFVDYYPNYIFRTLRFLPRFLTNFILKVHIQISKIYFKAINKKINIENADLEIMYKEILEKRFGGYFSKKGTDKKKEVPVDDILDIVSQRVGNPFTAIKNLTYKQFKSIIDGYILNNNRQTKEGEKENIKLIKKDILKNKIEKNKNNPNFIKKQEESFNILDKVAKKFIDSEFKDK